MLFLWCRRTIGHARSRGNLEEVEIIGLVEAFEIGFGIVVESGRILTAGVGARARPESLLRDHIARVCIDPSATLVHRTTRSVVDSIVQRHRGK